MTKTFEELKSHFEKLSTNQGYILESDYHDACFGVTDESTIDTLGKWLLSSGIALKKGVGQQYQQELLKRIKNPNVRDVKDTKHRTHKNTDKEQESKRKHLEEASFHLNKTIDKLKAPKTEDEFLPSWKKRKADKPIPTFKDMVNELVGYLQSKTAEIPNAWGWIKYVTGLDSYSELQDAWTKIYSGDYTLAAPQEKPPKAEFKEYKDLPTDDDEVEVTGVMKLASYDPIDSHLYMIAKNEYTSKIKKKVVFDTGPVYTTDVAETPAQKAAGLEVFEDLPKGRGLLFPFDRPDHVTFHMGSVKFPIDILFFMQDDLGFKVAKIIHNAQPGVSDLWSNPQTVCVLELPGGTCAQDGIDLGHRCQITDRIEV